MRVCQRPGEHGRHRGQFSSLTQEIDPRLAEDSRLLNASPSLDVLYRMKLTWQDLDDNLSALARELSQSAKSLEEELARLDQAGQGLAGDTPIGKDK